LDFDDYAALWLQKKWEDLNADTSTRGNGKSKSKSKSEYLHDQT
jgi:hypothetical protein